MNNTSITEANKVTLFRFGNRPFCHQVFHFDCKSNRSERNVFTNQKVNSTISTKLGLNSFIMKSLFIFIASLFFLSSLLAQPTITANGPLEFCEGDSVILCVEPTYSSYLWNNGSTDQCITVKESGSYWLVVLNQNGDIDSSLAATPSQVMVHPLQNLTVYGDYDSLYVVNSQQWISFQWYVNGVPIPNTTQGWLIPFSTGNYQVEAINSIGCLAESIILEVTQGCFFGPMGIRRSEKIEANIFPNPVSNNCYLTFKENDLKNLRVNIFDTNGKSVFLRQLNTSNTIVSVDTRAWQNGIYFLSIITEDGRSHTEKLIVNNE